jgi:hypothetical protein
MAFPLSNTLVVETRAYVREQHTPPAILDLFPYPQFLVRRPAFLAGLEHHKGHGYRCDNPHELGTIERHEWRAGWDYGDTLIRAS